MSDDRSFLPNDADVAREMAKRLGQRVYHYPLPTLDELADPNWEQQEIPMTDEEILNLPVIRQFVAEDGYMSSTTPTIGEIIDMIEEIRIEHSKTWRFKEK